MFPDQDPDTDAREQTDQTRKVSEDADVGDPVGDARQWPRTIGADGSQEILFYTLEDDPVAPIVVTTAFFVIDSADGPDQSRTPMTDAELRGFNQL